MDILRKVKMYTKLYFSINKNMFFEKYKFINIKEKYKTIFYFIWFLIKNYLLIFVGILVMKLLFDNVFLCVLLLIMLVLSCLLKIDSTDWKVFSRDDYIIAFPKNGYRCIIVLLGNIVYNLFIDTNIFIYGAIIGYYLEFSIVQYIFAIFSYLLLYVTISIIYFVLGNSTMVIKKIYSFFNYCFSFLLTAIITYYAINFLIKIIKLLIIKETDKSMFADLFYNEAAYIFQWMVKNLYYFIFIAVIIILSLAVSFIYTLWRMNRISYKLKDDSRYVTENFKLVSLIKFLVSRLYGNNMRRKIIIDKELALFSNIYKYNFRDYWFVFCEDRSVAILIGLLFVVYQYEFVGREIILLCLFPMFLMLDINSGISVKMLVNMSFISDYNTIIMANSNGLSLKEILNCKLRFFYIMKSTAYIFFFIIMNAVLYFFKCSLMVFIGCNLLCFLVLFTMPENYLVNNLIYTRINYRDYNKYLEESQILENGISEFIPINLLFKGMGIATLAVLIYLIAAPLIGLRIIEEILLMIVIILFIAGIVGCYLVMKKIHNNIISFIERGDYSADFAKIFKK